LSPALGRTFASVRNHRNYRLYFGGQAISFPGTWMQQIAAAWLVLQLTGSAVAVGALALVQLLPVTALGLFVGTALDRFDVRRVALLAESASLLIAAALAALTLVGVVTVWESSRSPCCRASCRRSTGRRRHALAFEMVGRDDLPNAIALNSSIGTAARILGPAIGGLVVAVAGAGTFGLSTIQLEAPERLRGRPASLYFFAFLGGAPLGGLLAGWLVSVRGTALAFSIAGTVALLTAGAGVARLRTA
jgi:MFS family permease